ncbi:MAG TPA: dTDP-4-amino-4,6-dideoxygalactose transaminase [Dongiaceae bacterium]|nr:dTDP-4-amino-4,6-dideoxygalactose transaminase [Dongiaceae bacterium]
MAIKFSQPKISGSELTYVQQCLQGTQWSGDGSFTERCHALLSERLGSPTLLTHSCTAALEMAAILSRVEPGDEVIMPSYTFVSTANAFVLRGAVPVFVDIRPDTQNLDETLLEQAVTPRTKAIVVVHYAGVACAMDEILQIADRHGLMVIEDAAQAYCATYKRRPLGALGALGALSFHDTKNVVSGEGGALIINQPALLERAQFIREKGTNRLQFMRREVSKYEWLDIGSSYLPSEIVAAVLLAQLEKAEAITTSRLVFWNRYHQAFAELADQELLGRPVIPAEAGHNGHIYYLMLPDGERAQSLRNTLSRCGIGATSHYVPLHSSPAGRRYGRVAGPMTATDRAAACLVRLPLHGLLTPEDCDRIIDAVFDGVKAGFGARRAVSL